MLRGLRLCAGLTAALLVSGTASHGQFYGGYGGYGGYGAYGGGWGSTVGGDYARGLGALAEGEGYYNKQTAEANAIDTNTMMRFNQYLYESNMEGRRRYGAYLARKNNVSNKDYEKRLAQIHDKPTSVDIRNGDSLNMILDDMTNPAYATGSALRNAATKISAKDIREIPFLDDTDAITISLDQLTETNNWPAALQTDDFKAEREAYQAAVDEALAEDKDDGVLKPATIRKVRDTISKLYAKADATYKDHTKPQHLQAINYLKGLSGLSKALERPNLNKVIGELEKIESTTVGNLVAFMTSYSLRFGAAQTPAQQAVYERLHPLMASERDRMIANKPAPAGNQANSGKVTDPTSIFYGLDPKRLDQSDPNTPPPPPTPANVPPPPVPNR